MRLSLLLCTLVAAPACGLTTVDVDQPIEEQHLDGDPLGGLLGGIFATPIEVELRSQLEAQDTWPAKRVTITSMALEITATDVADGDTDDWSFLDHVEVVIGPTAEASALPEVVLATGDDPGATTTFTFEVDGSIDLVPYLEQGCHITSTSTGTAPPDDVSFDGLARFEAEAL